MDENRKNISNEVTQLLHSSNLLKLSIFVVNNFLKKWQEYKIEKDFNFKKVSVNPSSKVMYKSLNYLEINYYVSRQFQKEVSRFFSILSKKIAGINFDLLAHNLKEFSIEKKQNILFINNYFDLYYTKKNKIFFIIDNHLVTFSYKFLHIVSFNDKKEKSCYGFYQHDEKNHTSFGKGIDSGYTEWLNIKYFSTSNTAFSTEKYIAYELEKIIGKKMEILYFNADLEGLIEELKKYDTKEKILEFIKSVDYINEYSKLKDSSSLNSSFSIIYNFLLNAYIKNLRQSLSNNMISEEQINNKIFYFLVDMFNANITNSGSKIDYKEINEKVKNIKADILTFYSKIS